MKVLMISAEAVPFAKIGGLADAVSALAIALRRQGHDVRIVIPRYYRIDRSRLKLHEGPMGVPCGSTEEWTAVYESALPGVDGVPVYFIDHEQYFGRDGIYGTSAEPDFADNPRRFSLLCLAAFQLCRKIGWTPDIFHAHDWSAALAPVLLSFKERAAGFSDSAGVFTIHNLGYQGVYGKQHFPATGLGWNLFYPAGFEDWDRLNFLKAALSSADVITTVSKTYAMEIQTVENGFRMDGLLRGRNSDLYGILNGIDREIWNPEKDTLIPQKYTVKTLEKKAVNKRALQARMGLPIDDQAPLFGMITRLVDQKGVAELFAPSFGCAYDLCSRMNIQMAVLGAGERWCETELAALSERLPNFRAHIGYDESLSHLIEAGSDFFLIPSRYEPCGLNQMYSLAYGTLPVARRTGGLADTIENYNEQTGEGTGFLLDILTPQSVFDTVGWAVYAWYNKKDHILAMKKRGMALDFSWDVSARKYADVYETAMQKVRAGRGRV